MREIDFKVIETLDDLLDVMLEEAEKETKKKRMPDAIKIHISNSKYGHHGDGKNE
tara:strand:+ start:5200 stop:5364 length:165 start_codon:yes stop_codon:yes gene_type:complete